MINDPEWDKYIRQKQIDDIRKSVDEEAFKKEYYGDFAIPEEPTTNRSAPREE